MQVKQDFQTGGPSPGDSLIQDRQLSLDIWVARKRSDSPITDWNPHMIQSCGSYLIEVVLSDPCIPVLGKPRGCLVWSQRLRVGVLIDDSVAGGPLGEDGRSDPWFEDKPTTQVYAVHFVVVVIKRIVSTCQFTAKVSWPYIIPQRLPTRWEPLARY